MESLLSVWVIQVEIYCHYYDLYLLICPFLPHPERIASLPQCAINVLQQVYAYFRGNGKASEIKRASARGAVRSAL